jgi:hypothetical protein
MQIKVARTEDDAGILDSMLPSFAKASAGPAVAFGEGRRRPQGVPP